MDPTIWKILDTRRALLIAGNAIGVALVVSWSLHDSAVKRVMEATPSNIEPLKIASAVSAIAPRWDIIQSRALFHASRSFYVPPIVPTAPVEVKPPPPAYKVATVLTSADRSAVALLIDAQGRGVLKVRKGDILEGWTVDSVAAKRVTLAYNEDRIELGPKLLAGAMSSKGATQPPSSGSPPGAGISPVAAMYPGSVGAVQGNVMSMAQSTRAVHVLGGGAASPGTKSATNAPQPFRPPP